MSTNVTKTKVIITTTGATYDIPADMSQSSVVTNYQQLGLSSFACVETFEANTDGQTRVLTFSPRTGGKGG